MSRIALIAAVAATAALAGCATTAPSPYGYGGGTMSAQRVNCGAGVVGGAVLGGLAGNQIGKGKGQDVATIAGATVGGLLGATRDTCQQQGYGQQPVYQPGYGQPPPRPSSATTPTAARSTGERAARGRCGRDRGGAQRALRRLQRPRPRPRHGALRRGLRPRDAARRAPWGTRAEGAAAVRTALAGRFEGLPDVHYGEAEHFADPDAGTGISKWLLTGTARDGSRTEVRGCDFYTFRDGKVVRKNSYWKIVEP